MPKSSYLCILSNKKQAWPTLDRLINMKATIKIYSKSKQTKKVPGTDMKETSIATRTMDTLTYEVKGTLPLAKKLAQIEHFATHAIGARAKAMIAAGKALPSKVFFEIDLDGRVFQSEGVLVRANMVNTIAISMSALSKLDAKDVIASVVSTQRKGLRASMGYLSDLKAIAAEAAKIAIGDPALSFMSVSQDGLTEDVEADVTTTTDTQA